MSEEPLQMVEELSLSVAFELLSHSHRRALLGCLAQHDRAISLADAAEEVVQVNEERPIQQIPAEEIKQVYMRLYHVHIPKAKECGVVEYEQERDLVVLTDQGEELVAFADALDL